MRSAIEVELVDHSPGKPLTGIGRYTRELYNHLRNYVSVRMVTHADPPFTQWLSFLHHMPIGVHNHRKGSIIHFIEDLGCSQMLWCPMHPAVATSHDLGMLVWPPEAQMHRFLDRILLRLSYLGLRRMDRVITISEFNRTMLIERLGIAADRIEVIYSGNDNELFRPVSGARAKLEQRYGLPDGTHYKNLLYVGSELPRKNMATLLKVLHMLPPYVRLLKVGSPGVKRYRDVTLRLIRQYRLEERVFFFEEVPEADLPLFYSAADVYLSTSFLEGFGHPVVEAMACGTPVICSGNSSMPELAGDAAHYALPTDAETFAAAVLHVLGDRALHAQMSERGRERAQRFSWDKTAAALARVYQQLAGQVGS